MPILSSFSYFSIYSSFLFHFPLSVLVSRIPQLQKIKFQWKEVGVGGSLLWVLFPWASDFRICFRHLEIVFSLFPWSRPEIFLLPYFLKLLSWLVLLLWHIKIRTILELPWTYCPLCNCCGLQIRVWYCLASFPSARTWKAQMVNYCLIANVENLVLTWWKSRISVRLLDTEASF